MHSNSEIFILGKFSKFKTKNNKKERKLGVLLATVSCPGNYALKLPRKWANMLIKLAQRIKRNKIT